MNIQATRLFATILILGSAAMAYASDKSAVIFPAEGNISCNDYSDNSLIKQMSYNGLKPTGTLTGPENPYDADTTGESASYTVDEDGKVVSFNATTPIDYALLKSGGNVAFIIYPSGGVTEDANMKLTVDGVDKPIKAISLCYGLGNVPPPPPPPTTIASCEDLNATGGLDGIQVICPNTGRSIVANFELDKPFYNTTETPMACVCNSTALLECNPNVAYPEAGACPQPVGEKSGAEVTTHIELNNDPYYCTTAGGIRKCYAY